VCPSDVDKTSLLSLARRVSGGSGNAFPKVSNARDASLGLDEPMNNSHKDAQNQLGQASPISSIATHATTLVDWNAEVDSATNEMESDPTSKPFMDSLLAYAGTKLEGRKKLIIDNLAQHGVQVLDQEWPGSGYNNVYNGGVYEVLTLLARERVLHLEDIMGGSGGAQAVIYALADPTPSSETLLRSYMILEKWWNSIHVGQQTYYNFVQQPPFLFAQYSRLIQDDAAFNRFRGHGYISCFCGFNRAPAIFHNFQTREQCVQAVRASGALNLGGFFVGTCIPGTCRELGSCSDGGRMSLFPQPRTNHLLYYHPSGANCSSTVTRDCITNLFKKGVDDIIALLESPDLRTDAGMIISPAPEGMTVTTYQPVVEFSQGFATSNHRHIDLAEHSSSM